MDSRTHNSNNYKTVEPLSPLNPDNPLLQAAKQVGPHVYELLGLDPNHVRFYTFGCHGDKGFAQSEVARIMDERGEPDFILILGDNFYPDGVDAPDDSNFQQFYSIYANPRFSKIYNKPCFVVLGNHDGKRHRIEKIKQSIHLGSHLTSDEAETCQVLHSYLPHPTDPKNISKVAFYSQKKFNVKNSPKWNMPWYFYSLIANDVQIFCLNSNTIVKDFLNLLENKTPSDEINQVSWFKLELDKAIKNNKKIIVAEHNPAIATNGKRLYHGDAYLYLSQDEISRVNEIIFQKELAEIRAKLHIFEYINPNAKILVADLNDIKEMLQDVSEIVRDKLANINTYKELANVLITVEHDLKNSNNYNKMLERIYKQLDVKADFINAHDHCINVYNDGEHCQITSGGGGSEELHERRFFGNAERLGCYMQKNGFIEVASDRNKPGILDIHVQSIEGDYLQFTNKSATPIRDDTLADSKTKMLRQIIFEEWGKYQAWLCMRENENNGGFLYDVKHPLKTIKSNLNFFNRRNQNMKHTVQDVEIFHTLINYLNRPTASNFRTTMVNVFEILDNITNKKSDHSLYEWIDERLAHEKRFENKSLLKLYKDAVVPKLVLDACREYEEILAQNPAYSSRPNVLKDITYLNDIKSYFAQNKYPTFEIVVKDLCTYLEKLDTFDFSLHKLINKKLQENKKLGEKTLEELYSEVKKSDYIYFPTFTGSTFARISR